MIQNIEGIHPEIERVSFIKLEMFCEGEVPVLLERAAEGIPWNGAKARWRCGRSGIGQARRTVRHHRRWRKACRIQIRDSGGDLALYASWVIGVCQRTTQEDAAGGPAAKGPPAKSVSHGKGQA